MSSLLERRHATVASPHVGDHVLLFLGGDDEKGIIVEERGPIGVGGRELFRIEIDFGSDSKNFFELPASEFRVVRE